MTLPLSGVISLGNFSTQIPGWAANHNIDMAFIYNNTRVGQQSYNIAAYYGKGWYTYIGPGNCPNGNCNCLGNCTFQCTNCSTQACNNCGTTDPAPLFQGDCNCACSYNCNNCVTNQLYNCNCTCY